MIKPSKVRLAIAAIGISGSMLMGNAIKEHYVDEAMIPVPGDRYTYGFGSTWKEDGTAVKRGDKTNPVRALIQLHDQLNKDYAKPVQKCVTVPVTINEAGSMYHAARNKGAGAFCRDRAPIWNKVETEEDYKAACESYIGWRETVRGRSCWDRKNNCYGLVNLGKYLRDLCLTPDGDPLPKAP
jgi:lysozyme